MAAHQVPPLPPTQHPVYTAAPARLNLHPEAPPETATHTTASPSTSTHRPPTQHSLPPPQVAQAPAANTSATLAADLVALAHEDQGWAAGAAAGGDGGSGEAGLDLSLLTACLLPSAQVGREALELPMAPSSCEAGAPAMLAAASTEQLLTHQGHVHEPAASHLLRCLSCNT